MTPLITLYLLIGLEAAVGGQGGLSVRAQPTMSSSPIDKISIGNNDKKRLREITEMLKRRCIGRSSR
jgi:hypothetical protein